MSALPAKVILPAKYWRLAAGTLVQLSIESLPADDPQRRGLVDFLGALPQADETLVAEYGAWRHRRPALTEALTWAGRQAEARRREPRR